MLALQVYSNDFDSDFFKLPEQVQARIERQIDRLGATLLTYPHQRLKGLAAYKLRIGNYRVIYDFSADRGQLFLLAVGHRREVYRQF
jgi:mRNA interferase RelE/StbE